MNDRRAVLAPATQEAIGAVLEEARNLGFLGPSDVGSHLEHALDFATIAEAHAEAHRTARVLDLGSGGGVPGLIVLAAVSSLSVVMLDSSHRRTEFLRRVVHQLEFDDRAEVITARAEEAGRRPDLRHQLDMVLSRSFGPPAVTAECAAPFLNEDGLLVVSEPPVGSDRWPAQGLSLLGLRDVSSETLEPLTLMHRFVVLKRVETCDERFPRRVGVPAKRPLFVSRET